MPGYFAVFTVLVLIGIVISRVLVLKRAGIEAMHFGDLDKTDFLIPPFALFYFYTIFAAAFSWPLVSRQRFFDEEILSWIGVFFCLLSILILVWSIISLGKSFRVGIDTENPDQLVTSGAFAVSRNPIYVGFWFFLLGQFLIFPNWVLILYLAAATWLFHRQVLREEAFLKKHYGAAFSEYCQRVRRYL